MTDLTEDFWSAVREMGRILNVPSWHVEATIATETAKRKRAEETDDAVDWPATPPV